MLKNCLYCSTYSFILSQILNNINNAQELQMLAFSLWFWFSSHEWKSHTLERKFKEKNDTSNIDESGYGLRVHNITP